MTQGLKLYELGDERRVLDEFLIETEGEVTPEIEQLLAEIEGKIEEKAERVALYIREQEAQAEAVEVEAKRLAARAKAFRNGAAGLKRYLEGQLVALGIDKVKGKLVTVALQKNAPSVHGELTQEALKEGRDYGKIPGVDKPSLLKPGAERIVLAFGCFARFTIVEQEIDHDREVRWIKRKKQWRNQFHGDREFSWVDESGVSLGLYRYVVLCEIVERASGDVVGSFTGSCSSMESKYIDRPRDSENTILKMAEKRGLVGAALVTYGLSDQFTQDVEDMRGSEGSEGSSNGNGNASSESDEPPITRDTPLTWGKKYKGTAIKDLPDDFLAWAIEPDRKFGRDTELWQKAMRAEVERREQESADAAADAAGADTEALDRQVAGVVSGRPEALQDQDDDLPF